MLGLGNRDRGVQALVFTTENDEATFQSSMRIWTGVLQGYAGTHFDLGPVTLLPRFALGGGITHLDYGKSFHDGTTGVLTLQGQVGIAVLDHFEVYGMLGGLLFGEPGHRVGQGGFAAIGGGVTF